MGLMLNLLVLAAAPRSRWLHAEGDSLGLRNSSLPKVWVKSPVFWDCWRDGVPREQGGSGFLGKPAAIQEENTF